LHVVPIVQRGEDTSGVALVKRLNSSDQINAAKSNFKPLLPLVQDGLND